MCKNSNGCGKCSQDCSCGSGKDHDTGRVPCCGEGCKSCTEFPGQRIPGVEHVVVFNLNDPLVTVDEPAQDDRDGQFIKDGWNSR